MASKPRGLKEGNEYCSSEIQLSSETVEKALAKRRLDSHPRKAEVLCEGTVICSIAAAGVRVLASKESLSEITLGRSHF